MRCLNTITIILLILVFCNQGFGQYRVNHRQAEQELAQVEEQPRSGLQYSRTAKFKLASRKSVYRLGEMISIDLAMLNISSNPVYFFKLSNPTLHVKDSENKEIPVAKYLNPWTPAKAGSYKAVRANGIITESYQLHAGCDERAYARANKDHDDDNARTVFERNLFVNWGQACLQIEHPGVYTIVAEQNNNLVITASPEQNIKTAVGAIISNPLTITIIE